jgi:dolichol-phosphate mannosyltransferase
MKRYVSIILPTLNEEKNIEKLVFLIQKKFTHNYYDIIFVDDNSSDQTRTKIVEISNKYKNIKYIFRKERNLATAFLDGVKKSRSEFIILMDSDLQHDPSNLNRITNVIIKKNVDMVIGSRFLKKSKYNKHKLSSILRVFLSKTFNLIFNKIFCTNVSDPLSGIFISKRKILISNQDKLFKRGFKIILDYLIILRFKYKIIECPIILNERIEGKSKLNITILLLIIKQIFFYLKKK